MMTRHRPRRYIPRTSHPSRPKRPAIRNNPLHYIRSILLSGLFLSLLPLKPSPNSRIRRLLTSHRNHPPRSLWSTPPKYRSPASVGCYRNMSPPQHYRRGTQPSHSIITPYYPSWLLFYISSSNRILRSPIYHCRRCLRINLFRRNRIPRPTCNHWLHISSCMPNPSNSIPLYIRTPLRIRSRRMILTLCGCSMIIPLHLYLLMRLIIFLVLTSVWVISNHSVLVKIQGKIDEFNRNDYSANHPTLRHPGNCFILTTPNDSRSRKAFPLWVRVRPTRISPPPIFTTIFLNRYSLPSFRLRDCSTTTPSLRESIRLPTTYLPVSLHRSFHRHPRPHLRMSPRRTRMSRIGN